MSPSVAADRRRRAGLSFVEVVVTLAVLATLGAVVFSNLAGHADRQRAVTSIARLEELRLSIFRFDSAVGLDLRRGLSGDVLNERVVVEVRPIRPRGQPASDGRLAGPHQADDEDSHRCRVCRAGRGDANARQAFRPPSQPSNDAAPRNCSPRQSGQPSIG